LRLEDIAEEILVCTRCDLHKTRRKAVPGEGPDQARVMLVGEAPGREEDLQGRPFVGASGKVLDRILVAAGLHREEMFITSVVKCRPPENRIPTKIEQQTCIHAHLMRQMVTIAPDVVILAGGVATKALTQLEGILSHRGKLTKRGGDLFFPTYHPAAARRNPLWYGRLLRDLKKLRKILQNQMLEVER
jgi:DNA polymerase